MKIDPRTQASVAELPPPDAAAPRERAVRERFSPAEAPVLTGESGTTTAQGILADELDAAGAAR